MGVLVYFSGAVVYRCRCICRANGATGGRGGLGAKRCSRTLRRSGSNLACRTVRSSANVSVVDISVSNIYRRIVLQERCVGVGIACVISRRAGQVADCRICAVSGRVSL